MIIDPARHWAFVRTPKAASTSVEMTLRDALGASIIATGIPSNDLPPIGAGAGLDTHATVAEAGLNGYRVFAIVRNPFDRFFSWVAHKYAIGGYTLTPDVINGEIMLARKRVAGEIQHALGHEPQTTWLKGATDIYRFEDAQALVNDVCALAGVPSLPLRHEKGNYRPAWFGPELLTDAQRTVLESLYASDVSMYMRTRPK